MNTIFTKKNIIGLCIFFMAGCGDGSSNSSTPIVSNSSSSKSSQASGFELQGTLEIGVGKSIINSLTFSPNDEISYLSSDPSIATVNNKGSVNALSVGSVTITGTVVSASGTSSYTYILHVLPIAPTLLKDTRLTLNVTKSIPTTDRYLSMGGITTYFSDTQFVEDASDTGVGKLDGTYSISKQSGQKINQLLIHQKNSFDLVRTILTYQGETSGTFVRYYDDPANGNALLTQEGIFSHSAAPFNILPKDLSTYNVNLQFKSVTTTLPALESPAVGASFNLSFFKNQKVNFAVASSSSTWNASYNNVTQGDYDMLINGNYENNGRPYKLTLHFNSFMYGTFSLAIDGEKTVASGDFNAAINNAAERTPLKGTIKSGTEIKSSYTKITYPYAVYLPANYVTSGKQYPVIYAMDGQWGDDLNYIVDQKSKDVILVQIAQDPWERRMIDYSPIGGVTYAKFLKEEFIPLIESQYNTNHQRTFFGGSVGSVLGAILLGDEPVGAPFFNNYILGDGTFWWYTPELLQAEIDRYNKSPNLSINLLLSTSPQGNPHAVEVFTKRYKDRQYKGLNIMNKIYFVPHENTSIPTFSEYIDILF